jgi:tetraacyldisaccharide 4'-kinase
MLMGTKNFPDHHLFTSSERVALQKDAEASDARLLTTEKDFVRLPPDFRAQVLTLPVRLAFEDMDAVERVVNG